MALEELRGTVLERIWLDDTEQQPGYRVMIWNPRQTTVQDVVLDRWPGKGYDVSYWVESVRVTNNQAFESGSDSVVSRAEVTLQVEKQVDIGGGKILDIDERIFADGTPIRIFQGDARVYAEDWPPVFTGVVRGYPGSDTAVRGANRRIRITALGREEKFINRTIVGFGGDIWPYDTDLGDMAVDVATEQMGLEREEIRFGRFDFATQQKSNALVDVGMMQGLWEIMRHVGRLPYFDAKGELVAHSTSFDKSPVYVYENSSQIQSIRRVQQAGTVNNSVEVTGLDATLSKVSLPMQLLFEYSRTLGWFDSAHRRQLYYSEDRTRRAENTYLQVVHDGGYGGSADWTEIDEFSGRLSIDTGYAPWVIPRITTAWALLAYTEAGLDELIDGEGQVELVQIRTLVQFAKAAATFAFLLAMNTIGRWEVAVFGEPFENVHKQNRAIATLSNINTADIRELSVRMDWLPTQADSARVAKDLLRKELVKSHFYQISKLGDAVLDVDDVIVIRDSKNLPNDRYWHFYINSIQRDFTRNASGNMMAIRAWKIRETDTI